MTFRESAVTIGVLPKIDTDRIISAGNTAGAGVSMIMASEQERELADSLPTHIEHIDLAARENFQNTYLSAMAFR